MNNKELLKKLVDLYAGDDLPAELKDELETAAFSDAALSQDMLTLKKTVETLRESPSPEFTDETYQRILIRIYNKGAHVEIPSMNYPTYLQLRLPIPG